MILFFYELIRKLILGFFIGIFRMVRYEIMGIQVIY